MMYSCVEAYTNWDLKNSRFALIRWKYRNILKFASAKGKKMEKDKKRKNEKS